MVLLTFVERLLCGKDTNCEEWGQLAMIGRVVRVSGEESRGKNRGVYKSNWRGLAHKTSQAFPTRQSSRPEARTAATRTKGTV